MSTLADLATRALHDDFAATKYGTRAREAIRTAIGMIYRGTSLVRGDYAPATVTIAAGQQLSSGTRARPAFYAITGAGLTSEGVTLVVSPIPDRTYTLQIIGRFAPDTTALDNDLDVIPLPADYEDLPVDYARSVLYGYEGDTQMSDFHLNRFNGRLQQLRGDLQLRSNRVRRIAGTWSTVDTGPRFRHPQGLF